MRSGSTSTDETDTAALDDSLSPPDGPIDAWGSAEPSSQPGARLSRYLVIEELGRGGMGIVLRAYDPKLQREVALKLVHARALAAGEEARLVREARAMARLNHPNVVAVYDVEIDEEGKGEAGVVVVMEYVAGATLGRWLRDGPRTHAEIVAMFVAAGHGLAAAHAEGLLHRDFKLANVLVGIDGRVRVTDFGLALATDAPKPSHDQRSPDELLRSHDGASVELTAAGTVMGTPAYMAPEQMEGGELDARSDQYAFCVALFQALTQRWPFEGRGRALLQAKRAGAPRWPGEVAVPRHVAQAVRRGLAPDPGDRWPSLSALLAELGRDRSRRRRRALAVGVVAFVGLGTWGMQRVHHARTLAACAIEGDRIDDVWNESRAAAIGAAFHATAIAYAPDTWNVSRQRIDAYAEEWKRSSTQTCAQAEVDRTSTPEHAQASRACLDEHRDGLDALLDQLAEPDASVIQRAASATASLPLLRTCTDETWLRHRPEPMVDPGMREEAGALRSRLAQAAAATVTGRYQVALEHAQAVREEAHAQSWDRLATEARLATGIAYERLGRYEDASKELEGAFFEAGASAHDELALRAATSLAFTIGYRLAQHDEGLRWCRIAQMLVERLGLPEGDVAVADVLMSLGNIHDSQGAYDAALVAFQRALGILEAALGPEHFRVATALNNVGSVHHTKGEYDAALVAFERSLAIDKNVRGPDHPDVASTLDNLGNVYQAKGAYAESVAFHEQALSIREKALGPEHPHVAMSLNNLATVYRVQGEDRQALVLFERALEIQEAAFGPGHLMVAIAVNNLGGVHRALGAPDKALALFERALAIHEKQRGLEHPEVAGTLNNIGNLHASGGDYERALPFFMRAVAIYEKTLGPEHPNLARSLHNLGRLYREREEQGLAIATHERALAIREKALGLEHPDTALSLESIGEAQQSQGEYAPALAAYESALAIRQRLGSPAELASTRLAVARLLWQTGGDRTRATELATASRDGYRSLGAEFSGLLADAETWLAEHALR